MRQKFILLASAIVLILLALSAFFMFTQGLLTKASQESENSLRNSLNHNVYSLKIDLYDSVNMTNVIADSLASTQNLDVSEARRRLREYNDRAHFKTLLLADLQGKAIDGSGHVYDVKGCQAYTRACQGETSLRDDIFNGDKTILIASPVIQSGRVSSVIIGEYDMFAMAKAINLETFNGESYAALIKKDGTFLIPSTSDKVLQKNNDNFFTTLSMLTFKSEKDLAKIKEDIQLGHEGFAHYSREDEHRLAYYMPLGINDWYLVKVVTTKLIESQVNPIKALIQSMIIKTTIIFSLLAALIYYVLASLNKRKMQESLKCKALADNIPGGVAELFITDQCQVHYANEGFYQLIGYSREVFHHPPFKDNLFNIMEPGDVEQLRTRLPEVLQGKKTIYFDHAIITQDGSTKWISGSGRLIEETTKKIVIQSVFTDITAEKRKTNDLLVLSKIDRMTGLYNKTSAHELIDGYCRENNKGIHILGIIDIDNFKKINDTYGHLAGDKAIIALAQLLKESFVMATSVTGRIGGDEFIFYERTDSPSSVTAQVATLLENVRSLSDNEKCPPITCSIGIVTGTDFSQYTFDDIFRQADTNLYTAKKKGNNIAEITSF